MPWLVELIGSPLVKLAHTSLLDCDATAKSSSCLEVAAPSLHSKLLFVKETKQALRRWL